MNHDEHWMRHALLVAMAARDAGEVPVGAVLVGPQQELLAEGRNQPIAAHDPTAHAEVVALRQAGQLLQNYRLVNTTLYVTLEPCTMCVGTLVHARVARVVFGAYDPKAGAICSATPLAGAPHFNHIFEWQGGVLADECAQVLKAFFARRRG